MMTQEDEGIGYDYDSNPHEKKVELASMLSGGVIIDVANAEEAQIAQAAGVTAVLAVDRVQPSCDDLPAHQSLAASERVQEIQAAVSIPVMARCRIGHTVEAQILEGFFLDFIEESEALPPADQDNWLDKHSFQIPFVCGCHDLTSALQRIIEGASMLRTAGGVTPAEMSVTVHQLRSIFREIRNLSTLTKSELIQKAKEFGASAALVQVLAEMGELPVPIFAAGGIRTPADAALMRQLGADGIFIGRDVFELPDSKYRLESIVAAVTHFDDPDSLAKISLGLVEKMKEIPRGPLSKEEILALRGW